MGRVFGIEDTNPRITDRLQERFARNYPELACRFTSCSKPALLLTHMTNKNKRILPRLSLLLICALAVLVAKNAFFPTNPLLLRSLAVDSEGKLVALSLYDQQPRGFYRTQTIQIRKEGVAVEKDRAHVSVTGAICAVGRSGQVLSVDEGQLFFCFRGQCSPVETKLGSIIDAGFTSEVDQRIVAWSTIGLYVRGASDTSSSWELPIEKTRELVAANWSGVPSQVVAVSKEKVTSIGQMESEGVLKGQVETWPIGSVASSNSWKFTFRTEERGASAFVSPEGTTVILFRSSGGRWQIGTKRKSSGGDIETISDSPGASYSSFWNAPDSFSDRWFRFLDEDRACFVDDGGSFVIVDCSRQSWKKIARSGTSCSQLTVGGNGSIVAFGTHGLPSIEIWRFDETELTERLHFDLATGEIK